ncbi:MAG: type II toxin-antitoxin system RelE/ParE family toxin [Acidimicrobiia bacterium]
MQPRRTASVLISGGSEPLYEASWKAWSAWRGTYRILYRIDDDRHEVIVLRVGHRGDVYRPG